MNFPDLPVSSRLLTELELEMHAGMSGFYKVLMLAQQALDQESHVLTHRIIFSPPFFSVRYESRILQNSCDKVQLNVEEGEALWVCTVVKQLW